MLVIGHSRVETDDPAQGAPTVLGYWPSAVLQRDIVPDDQVTDLPVVDVGIPVGVRKPMDLGANGVALVEIPTDEVIEVQLVDDEGRSAGQGIGEKDRVLDTLGLFWRTRIPESFVAAQAAARRTRGRWRAESAGLPGDRSRR